SKNIAAAECFLGCSATRRTGGKICRSHSPGRLNGYNKKKLFMGNKLHTICVTRRGLAGRRHQGRDERVSSGNKVFARQTKRIHKGWQVTLRTLNTHPRSNFFTTTNHATTF
ncbi:unnamed protein product, partial [Ectocarpus sp. 8 AP-2014]